MGGRNAVHHEEEWPQPKGTLELGILVLDGSGSMGALEPGADRSKAEMVEFHLFGHQPGHTSLLERLKSSTRSNDTQLAVITFDHRVRRALPPTPVTQIPDDLRLELLGRHGGATAIGLALLEAERMAQEYLSNEEQDIPRYVLILLMSDGREEGPQAADPQTHPVAIAEQIRRAAPLKMGRPGIVVAAAAYGEDADEETLRRVVTQPWREGQSFFKRLNSGAELREFFIQSMSAVDMI